MEQERNCLFFCSYFIRHFSTLGITQASLVLLSLIEKVRLYKAWRLPGKEVVGRDDILKTAWILIPLKAESRDKSHQGRLSGLRLSNKRCLTLTQFSVIFLVNDEIARRKLAFTKIYKSVGPVYQHIYLALHPSPRVCLRTDSRDTKSRLYLKYMLKNLKRLVTVDLEYDISKSAKII